MASDILIVPNRSTGNPAIHFTGSAAQNIRMEVLPSGSVAFIGTSGSLFSITDNLVGSLMSVSDVSGIPILEVFSDDRVVMGQYNKNTLVVAGSKIFIGTNSGSNGILQLGMGTTTDAGIGFGPDTNLYRQQAGWLVISSSAEPRLCGIQGTSQKFQFAYSSGLYVDSEGSIIFRTNGATTALTLTTGQNATLAGTLQAAAIVTTDKFESNTNASWVALGVTAFRAIAQTVWGGVIGGYGTTNDASIFNRAGSLALSVIANTVNVTVAGNFTAQGTGTHTFSGPISIDAGTNRSLTTFTTFKGTGTDGNNIWIGGGGLSSDIGAGPSYWGSLNTAVGWRTLYSNTVGYCNSAIGYGALYSNTSGNNNVANGYQALGNATVGLCNVAIGANALNRNTTGSDNVAIGMSALYTNSGSFNVAVGKDALFLNKTGINNVAVGYQALYKNNTGTKNTATGYQALFTNSTGVSNVANGYAALFGNTTGNYNVAIGHYALVNNTTGQMNVANGYGALYNNITGNYNVAIGYQALNSNNANYNVANGYQALNSNTTGQCNVAIGGLALYHNGYGSYNVANGYNALHKNTTGTNNIAIGQGALYQTSNGYRNVGVGSAALSINQTGNSNTAIGYNAGSSIVGSGNIAIGNYAGWYAVGSDELYVDNQDRTNTAGEKAKSIIYGVMASTVAGQSLYINASAFCSSSLSVGQCAAGGIGEIRATSIITQNYSDERLKTRLENIPAALNKVLSLSGFYYEPNEIAQSLGYEKKKDVGVSAQEVQLVQPEAVAPAPIDNKYLTVRYEKLVPLLIEAIKEQNSIINNLTDRMMRLEK